MERLAKTRRVPTITTNQNPAFIQPPNAALATTLVQLPVSYGEQLYASVASKWTQPNPDPNEKSKDELIQILTDTITSVFKSDNLKIILMATLNAMLITILNV